MDDYDLDFDFPEPDDYDYDIFDEYFVPSEPEYYDHDYIPFPTPPRANVSQSTRSTSSRSIKHAPRPPAKKSASKQHRKPAATPQITSVKGKELQKQLRLKVLDAVRCGHIEVLESVHSRFTWFRFDFIQSVQVTSKKSKKTTPLICACKHNRKSIVEWLLHKAGKFYEKSVNISHNPKFSTKTPDPKIVYDSALMTAVSSKRVDKDLIKKLLERGNQRLGHVKRHQVTALHIACSRGNVEVVSMILQYNRAWIAKEKKPPKVMNKQDLKDKNGNTPFMLAVLKNKDSHRKIMRLLLEDEKHNPEEIIKMVSKDLNEKNFNAMLMAALGGQLECLIMMEEYNAISDDIGTIKTMAGWNIIHCVAASGSVKTLDWLLKTKADSLLDKSILDAPNAKGYTPLLLACEYQHVKIVKYLVKMAASIDEVEININAKTNEGLTALHLAAMHNAVEIVDFVLQYEDVDLLAVESKHRNSVLHIATSKRNVDVENRLKQEKDYDELKLLHNNEGKTAEDIRKKVNIPREVENRGEKAVEAYLKALKEGTTKNSQCNLIILGEGRVGKTSLIRNILGKDFEPNCKPTQGVQLNQIEAVAEQVHIVIPEDDDDTLSWKTTNPINRASDQFAESVANAIYEANPLEEQYEEDDTVGDAVTIEKEVLLLQVDNLMTQLEPHVKWETKPTKPKPKRHPPGPHRPAQVNQGDQPQQAQGRSLEEPSPDASSDVRPPNQVVQSSKDGEPMVSRLPSTQGPVSTAKAVESLKVSDTKAIGKKMRRKVPKYKDKFVFNAIDFAGQSLYRPMHHCFITHKAVYIVVFKLTDVLKQIRKVPLDKDPIREIQYWLNNVLAHASVTQNSDPPKIFLVGTHRNGDLKKVSNPFGPLSDFDLDQINDKLLRIFFMSKDADERYKTTVQFTSKKGGNIIFCVENSSKDDEGVKLLKSRIIEMKEKIGFLNEDIPTSYIRFEKLLLEMQEERRESPLVTTRDDLEKWASECGIAEPEAAIQFYHDIRSIIDQRLIKTPFPLMSRSSANLGNLVLLSPQWLGDMMCKIVELRIGNEQYDISNLILFEETRVLLRSDLLKCLLGVQSFTAADVQSTSYDNLLNVLQSYCLIYPLNKRLSAVLNIPGRETRQQQFLIPCRMPKDKPQKPFQSECYKFEFCYHSYLPYEVYVHCLLRMLDRAQLSNGQQYQDKQKIDISDTWATLSYIQLRGISVIADWKIEINEKEHSLVFSICPHTDDEHQDQAHRYIVEVDEFMVSKVSRTGSLGCLSYKGGPRIKCSCVHDDQTVILPLVKFVPGEDIGSPKTPTCVCECGHKTYNVDEILKSQLQPLTASNSQQPIQVFQNIGGTMKIESPLSIPVPDSSASDVAESTTVPSQPAATVHPPATHINTAISRSLIIKIAEVFHQHGKRLARYLGMMKEWKEIVKEPHSDDDDEEDIEIDNVQKLLEMWFSSEDNSSAGKVTSLKEILMMIDAEKANNIPWPF